MGIIFNVGIDKISGWDIFVFILAICFIMQTLGELFRGERSLLTGAIFVLVSVLVVSSIFMNINVDEKMVTQVNQEKYDLGCEPETKSKTSLLFFITCTNGEMRQVNSSTYQYYKDITDGEPTKLMKLENLIIYIFRVLGVIIIILALFNFYRLCSKSFEDVLQ